MKKWLIVALVFALMLGIACSCALAVGAMENLLPYLASDPEWKYVDSFKDGYAYVEYKDGKKGYINPYGEYYAEMPSTPYDMSAFYVDEKPKTSNIGDEYRIVDSHKNILLKGLEEAYPFSDGVTAVKRDGTWYIIDAQTILQNVQLEYGGENRVMKSNVLDGSGIDRRDVRLICFENTMDNAPANAWDASAGANYRVLAYISGNDELYIAAEGGVIAGNDCRDMFAHYTSLMEVRFNGNLDTAGTRYVAGMFADCPKLSKIDSETLDLSNAVDADRMFDDFGDAEETVQPTQEPETNQFEHIYLKKDSRGEEVRLVQQCLINLGYLGGRADGIYGNNTVNAVKTYQRAKGYDETGEVNGDLYKEFYDIMGPDWKDDIADTSSGSSGSSSSKKPSKKKPSNNSSGDSGSGSSSGSNSSGGSGNSTSSGSGSNSGSGGSNAEPEEERRPETTKKPK